MQRYLRRINRTLRQTSITGAMKSRPFIALAAFLTGAAIIGSFASASIPGNGGIVHACFSTKTGALRIIDASKQQCIAGKEKKLNWSQKGPTGAPGVLSCSDEQRIKAAAPAFALSEACGGGSTTPSSSATTTTPSSSATTTTPSSSGTTPVGESTTTATFELPVTTATVGLPSTTSPDFCQGPGCPASTVVGE